MTVHDAVADNRGNVHVVWEGRFTGRELAVRLGPRGGMLESLADLPPKAGCLAWVACAPGL